MVHDRKPSEAAIAEHEAHIKVLMANDAELFRQVSDTRKEMGDGFNRLSELIRQSTKHQPANWPALVATAVAMVAFGYNHIQTVKQPLEAADARASSRIEGITAIVNETARLAGITEAKTDHNFARVHEMSEEAAVTRAKVANLEGTLHMLEKQTDAIDLGRSRGWNQSAQPLKP